MKLSITLVVILLPALLLISIGATYFYYQTAENILKEQAYYHLETTAQSKADCIESFLTEQKHEVGIITTHQELTNEKLIEIIDLDSHFYELFTLDSNGKVIASSDESHIGLDKSTDDYFINAQDKTYIKDAYYSETIKKYSISISTPYAGGVLVARIKLDDLNEMIADKIGLGETGEAYLVNKKKYMITYSRFKEGVILKQKVDTKGVEYCFGHPEEEHIVLGYPDYRGIAILGAHTNIEGMPWCLLAEIDEAEISERIREHYFNQLLVTLIGVTLFVILMGFFIENYFDKRKKGKKIKKYPCGIYRKSQPWYCRLMGGKCKTYPHGRCGKVITTRRFFAHLKLRYYILFATIFIIIYFFTVVSFFQGWRNAILFDAVPDLIFFIIAFTVLGYAFKLKNKARKFLVWGAGLLCLVKLSEIPLQELQAIRSISPFLWYPSMIISVLSFLLILVFFKEVLK